MTGKSFRIRRWLLKTTTLLIIFAAVVVGMTRFAFELIPGAQDRVQQALADALEREVRVADMTAGWRRFSPSVELTQVTVMHADGQSEWLRFDSLVIGISLLGLLSGELQPVEVGLIEPMLDLRQMSEGGQSESPDDDTLDPESIGRTIARLGRVVVENGELLLSDPWHEHGFLRLTEVNLEMVSEGRLQSMTGGAVLPPSAGGAVSLDMIAQGSLSDLVGLDWKGDVLLEDPDPAFWLAPLFRPGSRVDLSESLLHLTLTGSGLTPSAAKIYLSLEDVSADNGPVFWKKGEFDADLKFGDADWRMQLNRLAVQRPTPANGTPVDSPASSGTVEIAGNPLTVQARLDRLDLADWAPWLAIVRPSPALPEPGLLNPTGEIRQIEFSWRSPPGGEKSAVAVASDPESSGTENAQAAAEGHGAGHGAANGDAARATTVPVTEVPTYSLSASLRDVGMASAGDIPGVKGLSGKLSLTQTDGQFEIDGGAGQIHLPAALSGPVPVTSLAGIITWQRNSDAEPAGWALRGRELDYRGPSGLQVSGGFSLLLPDDAQAPMPMDLDMRFAADDALAAKPLIPVDPDVFPVEVQEWLRASILGGSVSDGRVQIKGALADFPYENEDEPGLFRVTFDLGGGHLSYADDWPEIRAIQGKLLFEGRRMDIQAESAEILETSVGPVRVWIADYHDAILYVDGGASAPAPSMLNFLRESPLHEDFKHMLAVLDLQGPATLGLKLEIPLDDLEATRVLGDIGLDGNTLQHAALPRPLEAIKGRVGFDNDGVRAEGLKGTLFGQPVSVNLSPRVVGEGDDASTVIDVAANTTLDLPRDREVLAQYIPPAVLERASGRAGVRLRMAIVDSPDPTPLALDMDLAGMKLDLPAPFGKSAGVARRLSLKLIPGAKGGADLNATLGNIASARVRWGGTAEVWKLDRGLVRFGSEKEAELPSDTGLWLQGKLREVDVDAWRQLLDGLNEKSEEHSDGKNPFRGAELRIQSLHAGGQEFSDLRVQLFQHPGQWWLSLKGPQVEGTVEWPVNKARPIVRANLEKLSLGSLMSKDSDEDADGENKRGPEPPEAEENAEEPLDPREFPGLKLTIKQLEINKADMGNARVVVNPVTEGVILKVIEVTGPGIDISGHGEWMRNIFGSQGRLKLNVAGNRIETLLDAAGYEPTLSAEKGDINLDVHWEPDPTGLAAESMSGALKIKLIEGDLLAVDPGAGRALGLLNFYALPRRLQFDFEDVTSPGLSFDELKGSFQIVDGNAYTDDLRMEGPSLKMRIRGRTGIAAQDYDQIVQIVPEIKSGVTLAAAVLGGPAVGAALLIAQELFEEPLSKVSELNYHLGGTWENPVVDDVGDRVAPRPPRKPAIQPAPKKAADTGAEASAAGN